MCIHASQHLASAGGCAALHDATLRHAQASALLHSAIVAAAGSSKPEGADAEVPVDDLVDLLQRFFPRKAASDVRAAISSENSTQAVPVAALLQG